MLYIFTWKCHRVLVCVQAKVHSGYLYGFTVNHAHLSRDAVQSLSAPEFSFRLGSGEHKAWVRYRLSYKHAPDLTAKHYLAEVIKKKRWEIKVWKKEGKKWHWLRKRLEPTTWKMVSHALANWASESLHEQLSGWVWAFKAELPGIQPKQIPTGMFDGEGVAQES